MITTSTPVGPFATQSSKVAFIPATVVALPGPGQGSSWQSTNYELGSYTPPSEAQEKTNATATLQNTAYDPFSQALCQIPNSSCSSVAPPYTDTIPGPSAGETWTQYQTDLTSAGITNYSRSTVDADHIDFNVPAGAVISVSPSPGSHIFPVTTNTVVTTNPDVIPAGAEALDDSDTTKTETTTEILAGCGRPLWHYTDATSAAAIYSSDALISTPENPPYPSGAFSTTLTPSESGWTQQSLSEHLFQTQKSTGAWVLFCSNENPQFTTPVPGAPVGPPEPGDPPGSGDNDYWYAPAPGNQLVTVYPPQAWGLNLMPAS